MSEETPVVCPKCGNNWFFQVDDHTAECTTCQTVIMKEKD
jgi:hypothetical protein